MKSHVFLFRGRLLASLVAVGLLVGLLAGALPLAAQTLPPGGTFSDDNGSLHEPDIEAIAAADITQGCSATQFCPNQSVTRGQMAAFLTRALDLPASNDSPFSDVSGQFSADINSLAASEITAGCGGGRFCPNDPVTRAQMATFLTRGLGLTPIVPPPVEEPTPDDGSYVNPINTGNKIPESQLEVVNGDLTITTDQHIENLLIRGRLFVRNGAEVTAVNISVLPEDDVSTPAIYVTQSARLTISHFTVRHGANAWSLRGLGVSGAWVSASFGDLSGAEDGINLSSSHSVGQMIIADSYIHDLKGSPPGGANPNAPHHDGIQVMAGNVLLTRSVFYEIEPSTAAIFPKSDFGDVTLTVRNTFASGGGFTIYRGDECCGYQVVTVFDNVEANPYPISNCGSCGGPGSRWGAVREVTAGATSSGTIDIVDWQPGEPGFHPGGQT